MLRRYLAVAVTAVCAGVMVVRLSWAGPRPAVLLADVCGRAQGSMLRQDALCGAVCGTELADCGTCGGTNVNIFQSGPGALGYGAYAYAAYPGYACVDQSSYDPWLWYDYYYKYDPYLAPYYEPWSTPEASAEGEEPAPAAAEEPEPEEEEQPVEEEEPPAAEEEEPERDRPHAQPAGTSTAGSFTLSGKSFPSRANAHPAGYHVTPIGGHNFDANGDPADGKMIFFDTSDITMQPHPPLWQ